MSWRSAVLLGRVAGARRDRELAAEAVSALRENLFESMFYGDVEAARALLSLETLASVPRQEVESCLDWVLDDSSSYLSWEDRVALRELRDELR